MRGARAKRGGYKSSTRQPPVQDGARRFPLKSPAFTLVELLVVIGVIAVVAGLLLPAPSKARARAMETKCAANLRAWGQAFYLYADDYNGYLPHTDDEGRNTPPFTYDPNHPEHQCGYIDVLPPYMGQRPWRDYPNGQKPTGGVWQCPAANPLPDSAYSSSFKPSNQGYHSYVMNSYVEQDFLFGLPFGDSLQPSFLKLESCAATSKTILMFEQTLDPSQGYGQAGGFGRPVATPPRMPARRANDTDAIAGDWQAMSSTSTGTSTGGMTCGSNTHEPPNSQTRKSDMVPLLLLMNDGMQRGGRAGVATSFEDGADHAGNCIPWLDGTGPNLCHKHHHDDVSRQPGFKPNKQLRRGPYRQGAHRQQRHQRWLHMPGIVSIPSADLDVFAKRHRVGQCVLLCMAGQHRNPECHALSPDEEFRAGNGVRNIPA